MSMTIDNTLPHSRLLAITTTLSRLQKPNVLLDNYSQLGRRVTGKEQRQSRLVKYKVHLATLNPSCVTPKAKDDN